jgi:hypothetical protein
MPKNDHENTKKGKRKTNNFHIFNYRNTINDQFNTSILTHSEIDQRL